MRSLPRPAVTGIDALKLCRSSIRDVDLKNRLGKIEAAVMTAEKEYLKYGEVGELHRIAATVDVGGHLTGEQMERVYNNTFVKSAKTRSTYDLLKKACENDICPLCGQGTVHQLDHYLPITGFPIFGVTAVNLIPACADCNKYKLAHIPANAGEQTIHPYFDNVEAERWLFARVKEIKPAALIFLVQTPNTWDEIKEERMATHFRTYRLGALYATHAAVEINNMRYLLQKMAVAPDSAQKISAHLRERAESCAAVHNNSWQRATLDALANSEWFCSGGFQST
jgi:hypothetical protein